MNLVKDVYATPVERGALAVCWLGQAGFLLKDDQGKTLVVDPYLTDCGYRIRGFKRVSPMLIQPETFKPDYYVTTHTHFDHFDFDAIPIVAKCAPETQFFGPSSCMEEFAKCGISKNRCTCLNRGEVYQDDTLTIKAILADHGSMAPDAIGLLVEMGGHRLYFSGDTSFQPLLFCEVATFEPDTAFLSINGKFGNMNAQEGVQAAVLTGVSNAVPCHCWTFVEHEGDLGGFFQGLSHMGTCQPICFRQGEIQILNSKNIFQEKEAFSYESNAFYGERNHGIRRDTTA